AAIALPVMAFIGRGWQFAIVLSLALGMAVVASAGIGAALPVLLHRLRLDPAIASGPLLGSATDIVSLTIYLSLASTFSSFIV
ncbi:MAG: magnesium transporter, partial [Actinomycetota bacterium]